MHEHVRTLRDDVGARPIPAAFEMTKAARLATANPGQWNRPQLFAVRLWKLRRHHLERLAEEPRPETEQIWFLVPIGARRQSISLELRIRRRERIKILRRRGIC